MGWVVSRFVPGKSPSTHDEGQYGRILAKRKSLVPTEERTLECLPRSEWLYRLPCTGAT